MENNSADKQVINHSTNIIDWENFFIGKYNLGNEVLEESMKISINRFIKLIPRIKKSSNLLIFSSGNSFLPIYLSSLYGCKVTVICANQHVSDKIQQDIESNTDETINVITRDLYLTGLNYNTYDMVWTIATLYKRHDLMKVLREINRILVPEGRLIFWEPTKSDTPLNEFNEYVIHSSDDILKIASRADLEKVYNKSLKEETLLFYEKVEKEFKESKTTIRKSLSESEYDSSLDKIQKLHAYTSEDKIKWSFIQFQKRNA